MELIQLILICNKIMEEISLLYMIQSILVIIKFLLALKMNLKDIYNKISNDLLKLLSIINLIISINILYMNLYYIQKHFF